jgi:parallel beta-helix repeat protein
MKKAKFILFILTGLISASLFAQTINVPADYATIQLAIDAAEDGATILIANGTYEENLVVSNKNLTIASEYINSQDEADIDATIIKSPASPANIILSISGSLTYTLNIIGLTLKDGFASSDGGAIYQSGYTVNIDNSKFVNNSSNNSGGAIRIWDGSATITNTYFYNNSSYNGGAISISLGNDNRHVAIENCTFDSNTAGGFGGAINSGLSNDISYSITNCVIKNNSANNGGGIYLAIGSISGSTPVITKNLIFGNSASSNGAGIYITGRSSRLTNNTIVKNSLVNHGTNNKGAAIYLTGGSNFAYTYLRNNIIRDNATESTDKELYANYSGLYCKQYFFYNCLPVSTNEIETANSNSEIEYHDGNISGDPLYADFANNDFNLQISSPCIDAGDPDTDQDTESYLVDANDRDADGTRLDIGALYYHQDIDPAITADFTFSAYGEYAPLRVEFTNASTWILTEVPSVFEWDFDNDGIVDSNDENPVFYYDEPGTYSVSFTAGNGTISNSVTFTDIIVVEDAGVELEELVFIFEDIEFFENLCDDDLVNQNVVFSGASSDPGQGICDIYVSDAVYVYGFSDTFIADFAQLDGAVLEVSIDFFDNCGNNCTGARVFNGSDLILSQSNPEMASGQDVLTYKFVTDINTPFDLFQFYGMESGLFKMIVKKVKQPAACELTADINVYEISCTEFAISENVFNNDNPYTIQWQVDGVNVDAAEISPLTLAAGEHTISLTATDNEDSECTVTVNRSITVYNPEVTIDTDVDGMDLNFSVSVEGLEDFNFSWYFGDEGNGSGDTDLLEGTYTYIEEGTYELAFTIMPTGSFNCSFNYNVEVEIGQSSECYNGTINGLVNTELALLANGAISAELYELTSDWNLISSTIIDNSGEFSFTNLTEGYYILRAVLNNPEEYPEYVISYFNTMLDQVFEWQQASPINMGCDETITIDFSMITIEDLLAGDGNISGYVYYSDDSGIKQPELGLEVASDVVVYLINNEDQSLVAQTTTDENGNYSFSNIPDGTYRVRVEVLSYFVNSYHIVSLSGSDNNFTHLDYAIGDMDIYQTEIAVLNITNNGNGSVIIDEITAEGTYLFEIDTELSILAVADENNVFAGWVGDVESTENPLSLSITDDISITAQFDDVSGIDQVSNLTSIYPNPCTDYFYLSNSENISQIVIYNQIGVEIVKLNGKDIEGFVNTSNFAAGVYFVRISDFSNNNTSFKIVKQ